MDVPQVAAYAGDHSDGRFAGHHDRPLLDMELKPCRDRGRIHEALSGSDAGNVRARLFHVLAQRAPSVALPALEVMRSQFAEKCARAEVGFAEPGAFLAAQP